VIGPPFCKNVGFEDPSIAIVKTSDVDHAILDEAETRVGETPEFALFAICTTMNDPPFGCGAENPLVSLLNVK